MDSGKLKIYEIASVDKRSLKGLLTKVQLQKLLIDRNLASVARKTGVRRQLLYKFQGGDVSDMTLDHIRALTDYHKSVKVA